jgi:RimJ/RimL family protein N-acetyltransferase
MRKVEQSRFPDSFATDRGEPPGIRRGTQGLVVEDNAVMELRPAYPITTPRLKLRPLAVEDTDELLAYRGRPDVCRYLPFEPMDEQVLSARLAGDLGRREITAAGQGLTLGVELAISGRLVGDVVLFFRSADDSAGEIGYVFHPDIAGQGYATEACAAVLDLPSTNPPAWACTGWSRECTPATAPRRGWCPGWACAGRPTIAAVRGSKGSGRTWWCTRCWITSGTHALKRPEWRHRAST